MRFMIKTLALFSVLVISTLKLATYSFAAPEIISVQPSATIVEKFAPIFIDITISADYDNPFNPEDIKVDALIEAEGKKLTVPGFYLRGDRNDSRWQVRFTPMKTGEYSYVIRVTSRGGEVSSRSYEFRVVDSERDGFLRINPACNYTFIFDSGRPFRGIGLNFGWESPWRHPRYTYEFIFEELNRRGANFIRTWMCPWNLPLEWNRYGLNRYDLGVAERLDEVIRLAERYGIYLILVLDYHGVLQTEPDVWGANDEWHNNPYNIRLGGPARTPREFLSNPEAREIYKRRLRYIVARWGYSPHIASWQFWNEIQNVIRDGELIREWQREMSDYMRQIDVHRHLLSTSSCELWGVWELGNLDFSQSHEYGSLARTFKDIIEEYQSRYNKPHIIGEFSYDWRGLRAEDHLLHEAELHDGLWRGLFSPTPVLPLTWWWECHYEHGNYRHIAAVSNFSAQIDYSQPITPLAEHPKVRITGADATEGIEDIEFVVPAMKGWGTNSDEIFTIDGTGAVENAELVPQFLFGFTKREQRNPPVFEVEFKEDGEFSVHVYRVSGQNTLRIWVDDEIALEQFLPLGPGEGEWKSSEFKPQWGIWQGVYNRYFSVPVKAGRRRIKVEIVPKEGDDWINITRYVFRGLGIRKRPEIMGLKAGEDMFLWIPNPSYNVAYIRRHGMPRPLEDMVLVVEGMNPGRYVVQLFDTTEGIFFEEIEILLDEETDVLRVNLPPIQKSIACKISFKGAF